MTDVDRQPDEARILPAGEPIEGGHAIFEGSLVGAHAFIDRLTADQRAEVVIWTPGHVFSPREFAAERPGHEHDPLAEAP